MENINNYYVNFTECYFSKEIRPEKEILLRKVCVPMGTNETKTKCVQHVPFNTDCEEYSISAEQVMEEGVQLQCYIECSAKYTSKSAAFTTYPTFVITLVTLLFGLILLSKRSH